MTPERLREAFIADIAARRDDLSGEIRSAWTTASHKNDAKSWYPAEVLRIVKDEARQLRFAAG